MRPWLDKGGALVDLIDLLEFWMIFYPVFCRLWAKGPCTLEPGSKLLRAPLPSSIALTEFRPVPTMCYRCYFCKAEGPLELSRAILLPIPILCKNSPSRFKSWNPRYRFWFPSQRQTNPSNSWNILEKSSYPNWTWNINQNRKIKCLIKWHY